jgi:hypothetical protein
VKAAVFLLPKNNIRRCFIMSKQSKARAKRHHKPQAQRGTEARIARMPEAARYKTRNTLLDELHKELYSKRETWGANLINLLYCELWSELNEEVSKQRKSPCRERVLNIIVDIKIYMHYS